MNEDVRCDLNAFGGFSDTPVHQRIRSLKAHLLRVGAGDKGFKLGNRTWCQVPQAKLSQLDSRRSLSQGLWTRPAVVPTNVLASHRVLAAGLSLAVMSDAEARVTLVDICHFHGVTYLLGVIFINLMGACTSPVLIKTGKRMHPQGN